MFSWTKRCQQGIGCSVLGHADQQFVALLQGLSGFNLVVVVQSSLEGIEAARKFQFYKVLTELLAHLRYRSRKNGLAIVDQGNVVAELFDRRHIVGGENDGASFFLQFQNFFFQQVGIDGIEAAEGLIKDEQFGFVQNGYNKLHFLLHPLRELLHFFVPPGLNFKFFEPVFEPFQCRGARHAFKTGQVEGLFAHFHFFVEAPLFGQVAYAGNVLGGQGMRSEEHTSELQSRPHLVCRLLLEKKNNKQNKTTTKTTTTQHKT